MMTKVVGIGLALCFAAMALPAYAKGESSMSLSDLTARMEKLVLGKTFSAVRKPVTGRAHVDIQRWPTTLGTDGRCRTVSIEVLRVFLDNGETKTVPVLDRLCEEKGGVRLFEDGVQYDVMAIGDAGFLVKQEKSGKTVLSRSCDLQAGQAVCVLDASAYFKEPAIYKVVKN